MRGDGHTAYGGNSRCLDAAVDAYLEEGVVPARGTVCRQEVPRGSAGVRARRGSADRGRAPRAAAAVRGRSGGAHAMSSRLPRGL